jgi:hypothetical protein
MAIHLIKWFAMTKTCWRLMTLSVGLVSKRALMHWVKYPNCFMGCYKKWFAQSGWSTGLYVKLFVCLFFTRSGRPALASVPDTINCRILISEYLHVYIISSWCDTTPGANSSNQHFSLNGDITQGGHPSKYWLSRCCCTSVLEIEGTGVSTSLGCWLWNLVCVVWSENLVRTLMWYE